MHCEHSFGGIRVPRAPADRVSRARAGEKDEGCKGGREGGAGRVAAVNEPHEL